MIEAKTECIRTTNFRFINATFSKGIFAQLKLDLLMRQLDSGFFLNSESGNANGTQSSKYVTKV